MNLARPILFFLCAFFYALCATAQRNATFEAYIAQYAPVAVEQMKLHGVPASITLAQGLLESGAGQSRLAVKGNNHFGIKTGGDWTGAYMLKDDDAPGERFRVYASAAQSFEDHSLFLRGRSRYASLFALAPTDYKGWARGLKAAGYATNPAYADRLIQLIETYDLARFDRQATMVQAECIQTPITPATTDVQRGRTVSVATHQPVVASSSRPRIYMANGAYYVLASQGDTYAAIGKRWGVSARSLRAYNEQRKGYEPRAGERVYLVRKPARAEKQYKRFHHVVRAGETLQAIAQAYAVRTRTLYHLNRLPDSYVPSVGDRIRIR